MASFIRDPKDFLSGLMFLSIGGAAIVLASDYPIGQAVRMGPGYFPVVLGGLLCLIGAICMIRSLIRPGTTPLEGLAVKPLLLVTLSTLLFGLLLRNAGMVAALAASIFVSSFASSKFTWKAAVLTFVLLTLFCYLVFAKALGLPITLLGPWITG